ncbi:MAG: gliding motility-associated C-terminal domain-containing protein [Bacteroidota bacterium]|nr:gliding motility-associated C-terminal domain-containing protein [Bacteroidota bacterium]
MGGRKRHKWQLPNGVDGGDSIVFDLRVLADSSLTCSTVQIDALSATDLSLTCVSTNTVCAVQVQTGTSFAKVSITRPAVTTGPLTITSKPAPGGGEYLSVSVEVTNTGDTLFASGKANLKFYFDADQNGKFSSADTLLSIKTLTSNLPAGGKQTLSHTFYVPAGKSCRILARWDTSGTNCLCAPVVTFSNNVPLANAGNDTAVCSGDKITLGDTATTNYVYRWNTLAGLSDSTQANPIFSMVNTGSVSKSYTYTLKTSRGSTCQSTDTIKITVFPKLNANAGSDATICVKDSTKMGGTPAASGGSSVYLYEWTPAAGLSSTSAANPFARPLLTTTYKLKVTDNKGCIAVDSVKITVLPLPGVNAGADALICRKDSIQLGGYPAASITSGPFQYKWTPTTGLSNAGIANPKAAPSFTTTYILEVKDGKGCIHYDTVKVTVNQLPLTAAGQARTICLGDSAQLGGNPTGSGTTTNYFYTWNPSAGLSNSAVANPYAKPAQTTVYSIKVTDENGCSTTDSVKVTVNPLPKAEAGNARVTCYGDSTRLGGSPTASGSKAPYVYRWQPSTGITFPDSANPYARPLTTTVYTLKATDANGCISEDSVKITVNPLPVITAGTDEMLCLGDTTRLKAVATALYTYTWQPGALVSDSTLLRPLAFPTKTTSFILTAKDSFGCVKRDTVTIEVRDTVRLAPPSLTCVRILSDSSTEVQWDTLNRIYEFTSYVIYRKSPSAVSTVKTIGTKGISVFIDSGVANALTQPYSYFIKAVNFCGVEGYSSDTVSTLILTGTIPDDKSLRLSWNKAVSKSAAYVIEIDTGSGFTFLDSTQTISYMVRSCGLRAAYRISRTHKGCISYSNPTGDLLLKDTTPPAIVPLLYSTVATHTAIDVFFKAGAAADTRSYHLYRVENTGSPLLIKTFIHTANGSYSFRDTGLATDRNRYSYMLYAKDSCDNVSEVSGVHIPVLLTGEAGNVRSTLTWKPYTGFERDTVDIEEYINGSWKKLITAGITDTTFTHTGLDCNTPYYYRIMTKGAYPDTFVSYSDSIRLVPFDTIAPAEVNILKASVVSDGEIHITFIPVADKDVNRYEISTAKNGGPFIKISTVYYKGITPYTFTHSGIGTLSDTFAYEVKALDSCSNTLSKSTERHQAIQLNGRAGNYLNRLSWSPYAGFAGHTYAVERLENGKWNILDGGLPGTQTTYTDSLLPCNETQYYRITTTEGTGSLFAYSDTIALTPFDTVKPDVPLLDYVSVSSNNQDVSLKWRKSGASDVRNYTIYRKTGSGAWVKIAATGNIDSFTDTSASPSLESYCYSVQAEDSCARNLSALSPPHCTMLLDVATKGCDPDILLSWNSYTGWQNISKVEVYRRTGSDTFALLQTLTGGTSWKDTSLSYHPTYCYLLMAYDSASNSISRSNIACKKVFFVDTPQITVVSKLNSSATGGDVLISWQKQSGKPHLAHYNLYYSDNATGPYLLLKESMPVTQDTFTHRGINTTSGEHYYYLQTIDSCGTASEVSFIHKTMDLTFKVGQLVHELRWTPYMGWDVKYYITQQLKNGGYADIDTLAGTDTFFRKFPAPCNSHVVYRLKAVSHTSLVSYSDTMGGQAIDTIPSNAPVLRNVSIVNADAVRVDFMGSDSADTYGYTILRSENGGNFSSAGFMPHITTAAAQVFYDTINATQNELCYHILTLDSCLNATGSDTFCAIQLKGTAENLANSLYWNPFKGYTIDYYSILQWNGLDYDTLANLLPADTFFLHDSINCNVPRTYKIAGKGSVSPYVTLSDSITLTPFDTIKSAPPVLDYISVTGSNSLFAQWQSGGSADVKHYEIQLKTGNGKWQVIDTLERAFSLGISGINTQDSAYCVRVVAYDTCAANRSLPSLPHCAVAIDGEPLNLAAKLVWRPYEGYTVDQYYIYRYINDLWQQVDSVPGNTNTYTDTGLACNVAYSYKVAAQGTSWLSLSDSVVITPFDTLKPAAPTLHYAGVLQDGNIEVAWSWDTTSDVKYFEVWRSINKGIFTPIGSVIYDSLYTDTAVQARLNSYRYYVIGIDSCDLSNRSQPSDTDKIITLKLATGGCTPQVRLSWTAYEDLPQKTDYYDVYKSVNQSAFSRLMRLPGTQLALTDSLVTDRDHYTYKILAVDVESGYTSFSDTSGIFPWQYPLPGKAGITGTTVTSSGKTDGSVFISWERSSPQDTVARGYKLYHATGQKGPFSLVKTEPDLSVTFFAHKNINTLTDSNFYRLVVYNLCAREGMAEDTFHVTQLTAGSLNLATQLNWLYYKGAKGNSSQTIYRADGNSVFRPMYRLSGTDQSFKDTLVRCNTRYHYYMETLDSSGFVSVSDTAQVISFDTIAPARPVMDFVSVDVNSNSRAMLQFNDVPEINRSSFTLYRSSGKGGFRAIATIGLAGNKVVFMDNGVSTGDSVYTYYVTSRDSCGNESQAQDTHTLIRLKTMPQSLVSQLTWNTYTGWKNPLSQRVERRTPTTFWQAIATLDGNVNTYIDSTRNCDSMYYYRIRANDTLSELLTYSNTDSLVSFETDSPAAPVMKRVHILASSVDSGKILVEWFPSASADADHYRLYRLNAPTGNWEKIAWIKDSLYYVDTLKNTLEKTYSYRVETVDKCGNTSPAFSGIHESMVLKATPGNEEIQLSWNPYTGWAVKNYRIYRDGQLLATLGGGAMNFIDTTVICPDHYLYYIEAVSASLPVITAASNTDGAAPYDLNAPAAVYVETATVEIPNSIVYVQWRRSSEPDVEGYRLYRYPAGTPTRLPIATFKSRDSISWYDTSDVANTSYCYEVQAFDKCGIYSPAGNSGCIILLKGKSQPLANDLSWEHYRQWEKGVRLYDVYRKTDSAGYTFLASVPSGQRTFSDTMFTHESSTYCYRIKAEENGSGITSWSTEICLVQSPVVWIPNTFTPYATYLLNDAFGPEGKFIRNYTMEILNRWGESVYYTSDGTPWKGDIRGLALPEGVYIYKIVVEGFDKRKYYFKGTLHLLR